MYFYQIQVSEDLYLHSHVCGNLKQFFGIFLEKVFDFATGFMLRNCRKMLKLPEIAKTVRAGQNSTFDRMISSFQFSNPENTPKPKFLTIFKINTTSTHINKCEFTFFYINKR